MQFELVVAAAFSSFSFQYSSPTVANVASTYRCRCTHQKNQLTGKETPRGALPSEEACPTTPGVRSVFFVSIIAH